MRKVFMMLAAVAATATGLTAQAAAPEVNLRVQQAQPGKWEVPDCGFDKGNFLIGSGATYIKSGLETRESRRARRARAGRGTTWGGLTCSSATWPARTPR